MWESLRIKIPEENCTILPRVKPGKKNGSFIAIGLGMKIHQNMFFSMTPSWKNDKERPEVMPKFLIVMWYICYCYIIAWCSLCALMYLKTETLQNKAYISVVFSAASKRSSAWVMFLAQILIYHNLFSLESGQIFFLACW